MRKKQLIVTAFLLVSSIFFLSADSSLSTSILPDTSETLLSLGSDEFTIVEDLINTTERNLEVQKELKVLLDKFRNSEDAFLKDQKNKEKVALMVEDASTLLPKIKKNHLTHIFPSKFISKLQFYSKFNR